MAAEQDPFDSGEEAICPSLEDLADHFEAQSERSDPTHPFMVPKIDDLVVTQASQGQPVETIEKCIVNMVLVFLSGTGIDIAWERRLRAKWGMDDTDRDLHGTPMFALRLLVIEVFKDAKKLIERDVAVESEDSDREVRVQTAHW